MIVLLLSLGLIGMVAYSAYGGMGSGSITRTLSNNINNGYRFRDVTFAESVDIYHPDVRNNVFGYKTPLAQDRGENGIPRETRVLYDGLSQLTRVSRPDHLVL